MELTGLMRAERRILTSNTDNFLRVGLGVLHPTSVCS
jgi:hypothetical protein